MTNAKVQNTEESPGNIVTIQQIIMAINALSKVLVSYSIWESFCNMLPSCMVFHLNVFKVHYIDNSLSICFGIQIPLPCMILKSASTCRNG